MRHNDVTIRIVDDYHSMAAMERGFYSRHKAATHIRSIVGDPTPAKYNMGWDAKFANNEYKQELTVLKYKIVNALREKA